MTEDPARIVRIRLHPVVWEMPADQAYGMARGLTAARGATIVEVETRDGISGFGEAWGPPGFVAPYLDFVAGGLDRRAAFGPCGVVSPRARAGTTISASRTA